MTSGVYQIQNTVNGKCYVGSSIDIDRRRKSHFSMLARGTHHSIKLARAYAKYGPTAFTFDVLETCEPTDNIAREEHWINLKNSARAGYNVRTVPNSSLGVRWSDESKASMSAICKLQNRDMSAIVKTSADRRRGVPLKPEHAAAVAAALKGVKKSPEHVAKVAAATRGLVRSPELRARISETQKGRKLTPEQHAARFGVKQSQESIEKRVAKMRGVPQSAEHVAKRMAAVAATKAANPEPPKSAEYRAKMSAALKGRVITPEAAAKAWATRRANNAAKNAALAHMTATPYTTTIHANRLTHHAITRFGTSY